MIQHRLGHATARLSMELYAHVPDRADRAVAARLDASFSAEAGSGLGTYDDRPMPPAIVSDTTMSDDEPR